MSIKKKILLSLGAMIVGSSAVLAINSPAAASDVGGSSNFQDSCRNIGISGNVLTASCPTINGWFIRNSTALRGIQNQNGILAPGGSEIASFHKTCKDIRISKNLLAATCRTRNGRLKKTAIFIDNLVNKNGILKYKQ